MSRDRQVYLKLKESLRLSSNKLNEFAFSILDKKTHYKWANAKSVESAYNSMIKSDKFKGRESEFVKMISDHHTIISTMVNCPYVIRRLRLMNRSLWITLLSTFIPSLIGGIEWVISMIN